MFKLFRQSSDLMDKKQENKCCANDTCNCASETKKENHANEQVNENKIKEKIQEIIKGKGNENKKEIEIEFIELQEHLQRLQAEFENYKKRTAKEKLELIEFGKANLINELLPVLDSFDQALKQNPSDKGLKLVFEQFMKTLNQNGLREINCAEKKFDAFEHECLQEKECEKEKGSIVEVIQKGFFLNNKILRHSKVIIAKEKEENQLGVDENGK